MRILIVADNASNQFGGEAFLPFNYFRLLRARNIDARLLVHERNKAVLAAEFPKQLDRLHYVKDTQLLLVANERTQQALPHGITSPVIELVENGVDFTVWRRRKARTIPQRQVRLIFVGRLVDWKAIDIVFEAIHPLRDDPRLSFEIV